MEEKLKRMSNRIKALELKAASPPPTPPREVEQPVQGSYSDIQDNKKDIATLRKKVFTLLQKLAPLSGDKAVQILRKDGNFDQLDEFCLAMSARVRDIENAPATGGLGSGVRVSYRTGASSFTTQDFNPNDLTLFPETKGGYQKTDRGIYLTKYAVEEDYTKEIALRPVSKFSTPMEIYNELNRQSREAVDAVKALCNAYPTAFFWHNGDEDDACSFHGLHIHLLQAKSNGARISTNWPMKNARNKLKRHNITVRTQKVNNMDGLTRHLMTQPRMLLGANNLEMCARIVKLQPTVKDDNYTEVDFAKDDDSERAKEIMEGTTVVTNYLKKTLGMKTLKTSTADIAPAPRSYIVRMAEDEAAPRDVDSVLNGNRPERQKPIIVTSKTATKVDMIKEFIDMYNQRSIDDLLKAIMKTGDKTELEAFRTLKLGPNFVQIFQQAISEIDISRKPVGHTFIDSLISDCEPKTDTMDTTETAILFVRGCREQGINPDDFLLKLYSVLDKTFPKLNCFTIHGKSNAGKTFSLSPLTQALLDVVGQTIQSQDFAYQGCCDKQIIEIPELTLTKPEQVEETKKIFEGIPTMINVKNKEPKKLERTPVLLSCNTLPWANFLNEQKALLNRMFMYQNLQESDVLRNVEKSADVRFYMRVFDFIRNEIATTAEWPQTPSDNFWNLYQDRVTDYL